MNPQFSYESLHKQLIELGFSLTGKRELYFVRPLGKISPIWEFHLLSEVLSFAYGVESQRTDESNQTEDYRKT